MAQPVVVGLCGSFGSGCTTVAQILRDNHGYQVFRLSDEVRRLATEYGLNPDSREDLQNAGNRVRDEQKPDYLAKWAIKQVDDGQARLVALDGIRNVAEVVALRKRFAPFFLLGVSADVETRQSRALDNGTPLAVFKETDARDSGEESVSGQQVRLCMGFADAVLRNNNHIVRMDAPGETERLTSSVERYHTLFTQDGAGEPSPDEILMGIADDAAMRSHCLRRRVGAVISTKDEDVLAVGRNDPPPSEQPCKIRFKMCYRRYVRAHRDNCIACGEPLEGLKCPHCGVTVDRRSLAGKELDYCRSLHAEEHAILQMAQRSGGIPEGAHLYTTTFPCFLCAKKIATLGIKRVSYADPYPMREAYELLENAGVELVPFEGVKSKAFHRVFTRPPALAAKVIDELSQEKEGENSEPVAQEQPG